MIWINNNVPCDAFSSARVGECRRFGNTHMTLKTTLTIVAALLAGGTSLAMAQNGPATGGGWSGGWYGGGWYGDGWYRNGWYGDAAPPGYGYGYAPGYGYGYAPGY